MKRRTVWQTAAVGLTAGLAGCASFDESADDQQTDDDSSDDQQTDDDSNNEDQPDEDEPNDSAMSDEEIDEETEDPQEILEGHGVAEASFSRTGDCSDPETASIEFLDSETEVLIEGCIQGRNGCSVPVLLESTDENGTLRIEISEEDFSDDDMVCTEAIVERGYELRVRFESEFAESIEVFHDGAIESGVVATASRP